MAENRPDSPPYHPGNDYNYNVSYTENAGNAEYVPANANATALPNINPFKSYANTSVGPNGPTGTNAIVQTNNPKSVIQSAVGALLCIPGWLAVRSKVAAASVSHLAQAARNRSVAAYTWARTPAPPKVLSIEEIIEALRAGRYESAPFLDAILQDASLSAVAEKSALNAKRAGNLKYRLVLQLVICLFNYENYQKRSVEVPPEIKNIFFDTLVRYLAAVDEQQSATARAVVGLTQMGVASRLTSQRSLGAHQDIAPIWDAVNAIIRSEGAYSFIRPSARGVPPTLDTSDYAKKAAFDSALKAADARTMQVTNSVMGISQKDGIVGFGNDVAESVQAEDMQARTCAVNKRPPSAALNRVARNIRNNIGASGRNAASAAAAGLSDTRNWFYKKGMNVSSAAAAAAAAAANAAKRLTLKRKNRNATNATNATGVTARGNNNNTGTVVANANANANAAENLLRLGKRAKVNTNGNGLADNGVNRNATAMRARKSRKSKKSRKSRKSKKSRKV
jgi:hypothetical protein